MTIEFQTVKLFIRRARKLSKFSHFILDAIKVENYWEWLSLKHFLQNGPQKMPRKRNEGQSLHTEPCVHQHYKRDSINQHSKYSHTPQIPQLHGMTK